ncbi:uncharacterized protein LOC116345832 [Contarinia nasturtii]|uniref:uncharacterized protein LOC116345832 n=1 Tax=Contarinia nasturtii TaxID=265458 RepID=UPI0012D3C92D|nr:uncharacterized protein LOC116345832 [Contarinia nasturtii]XP_031631398.1 uncharacterized protein LOC116345832 [Contarinia nasturtii]
MSHLDESIAKRRCQGIKTDESSTSELQEETSSFLQLNDDCLYAVFGYLNVESLCHVANVCKRFKTSPITEQVFKRYHRHFFWRSRDLKVSVIRRVIYKFGHLITSFDLDTKNYDQLGITFDDIVKYCSQNLECLELTKVTITCDKSALLMPRLKYLSLYTCDMDYKEDWNAVFRNCPELETLNFFGCSCKFLVQLFPKLTTLDIWCKERDTIFDILSLNPQLKNLTINDLIDDEFIKNVVEHGKDLEELYLCRVGSKKIQPQNYTVNGLLQLGKLKKLKKLQIDIQYGSYSKVIPQLMKAFSNENILIEELTLRNFFISSEDIKSLGNLKTLQFLHLSLIKLQVTGNDLVILVAELPLLRFLCLEYDVESESTLTVDTLIRMVQLGKNFEYLALERDCYFKLTEEGYTSLLKAIQNNERQEKRFSITISDNLRTDIQVPESILLANREYLDIDLSAMKGSDYSNTDSEEDDDDDAEEDSDDDQLA